MYLQKVDMGGVIPTEDEHKSEKKKSLKKIEIGIQSEERKDLWGRRVVNVDRSKLPYWQAVSTCTIL